MIKLTKPEGIIALVFFLLILGQLANLKFYGLGLSNVYIFDIALVSLAIPSLSYILLHYKTAKFNLTTLLLVFFTVVALLSLILNNITHNYSDFFSQVFYLIRWSSYMLFAFVISCLIRSKEITINYIYKLILLSAIFLVVVGFVQLYLLPDFTVLDPVFGWDPHKGRLASTFFDPNFTAAYIVIALSICLGHLYYTDYSVFSRKNLYIIFLLLCCGLVLTFSRSGWGMFVIVLCIFGILKYRLLLLFSLLTALFAYALVPRIQTRLTGITDPSDSAHFRVISWSNAFEVYKTSPIIGVGFNSYREAQKIMNLILPGYEGGNAGAGSDSSILFVLATTGGIGISLFVISYLSALITAVTKYKTGGLIIAVILVALFLESIFINSLFYPQIMILWLVLSQTEFA